MSSPLPFLLPVLVLALPASAVPLEVVEVSAPAVNCVFDGDCRITVNDSTAAITLPASSGQGFLQTRTAPPGEPGTTGGGFIPYEYRIDLRQIGGLTALPCITELSLDFGAHQPLDYDGDGDPEDVFVVTAGGLGSVGLASAERTGDRITFRLAPAVCAGNRSGSGESTFFFGLAAAGPPQPVTARAVVSLGGTLDLDARAPAAGEDGGAPPPPIAEPCFPDLPISADVPVCRCLHDATLRELRCGVFHPDFRLVRRTPLPIPPGKPFTVSWTLEPVGDFSGAVVVDEGLAPGFRSPKGPPRLKLQTKGGRQGSVSREYRLKTSLTDGKLSVPSLVTVTPRGGSGGAGSFQLLLPIGPAPWPGLSDAPAEPRIQPPARPAFGPGPCGAAAQRLWNEHVARFAGTYFGLSYAEYTDLRDGAERCRRAMPTYEGRCANAAQAAWADCYLRGGRRCADAARLAVVRCERP
jgi:hypothetical protein